MGLLGNEEADKLGKKVTQIVAKPAINLGIITNYRVIKVCFKNMDLKITTGDLTKEKNI